MSKAEVKIAAQLRNEFGDNASRRLRKSGYTPAVIYSCGKPATAITLKTEEWLVASATKSEFFAIELNGETLTAKVKEVQFNHLKDYVYHVDFQQVEA